ncbi:hypothetical protein EXS57_01240 [Candidatus Kaiserbacteria bacterium]|nr:hypothetical protein [Candidatus Kaiserbacteria bacterium]
MAKAQKPLGYLGMRFRELLVHLSNKNLMRLYYWVIEHGWTVPPESKQAQGIFREQKYLIVRSISLEVIKRREKEGVAGDLRYRAVRKR